MYQRISSLLEALSDQLYERDQPVRLGILTALSGESLFLLGRPGTGKSLIARRLHQAFADARTFSYLMGRFSTPDEVFGPISIQKLREEDRYERRTQNYLPDADVVFLDEIWKASPPIQNALLTALNERIYRNGTQEIDLPLKVFIGASNELPQDEEEAAAFWDRFLVRLLVEPIRDTDNFSALLEEKSDPYRLAVEGKLQVTAEEYRSIQEEERRVVLPPNVLDLLGAVRKELAEGTEERPPVYVSDRRWKKIAKLLRVSALLHDREKVEPLDCSIIRHCAWSSLDEREHVDAVVDRLLSERAGSRELSEETAARLAQLRESYEQMSFNEREVEEERARLYRDEYYRLLPAEASDDADSEDLILVWHGDIDDLATGRSAEIDLFFYGQESQLTGSEQAEVTRKNDWSLAAGDREFRVETSVERTRRTEEREPAPEETAALSKQVTALLAEVDANVAELLAAQKSLEDAGHRHLFVSIQDAEVVLAAVNQTLSRLGELRVLVQDLLAQLSGA